MAAIIFDDPQDIEKTVECLADLRRKLGKPATFQFHCANASPKLRRSFMEAVQDCPFRVRAIIIHKSHVSPDSDLLSSRTSLYNFTLRMLLERGSGQLCNAKIFLDKRGERRMRKELTTYLRQQLNTPDHCTIADFRFASKTNDLIQLADMVVGVIARAYCGVSGAAECQQLLRQKTDSIRILGKKRGQ